MRLQATAVSTLAVRCFATRIAHGVRFNDEWFTEDVLEPFRNSGIGLAREEVRRRIDWSRLGRTGPGLPLELGQDPRRPSDIDPDRLRDRLGRRVANALHAAERLEELPTPDRSNAGNPHQLRGDGAHRATLPLETHGEPV